MPKELTRPPEMRESLWAEIVSAPPSEGVLRLMAWMADEQRVREVGGNNRGLWVKRFLKVVGLPEGYAWCAACLAWCCVTLGAPHPKGGAAAVRNWVGWAADTGRQRSKPARGRLCYWLNPSGTGHIGIVVRSALGLVYSIEGNTGPDEGGNQRDGDGLYRRVRRASLWHGYIDLEGRP